MKPLSVFYITIIILTVSYSLFGIANDNPNAYKTEINSIHSKSIETVDELYSQEENYLKYINSSTNAKHTAYAYYQLALLFSNHSKFKLPEKIVEYCEKALSYPQPPMEKAQLYQYLSSAQSHNWLRNAEKPIYTRTTILSNIFKGIRYISDNIFTNKVIILNPPLRTDYRGTNASHQITQFIAYTNRLAFYYKEKQNNRLVVFMNSLIDRSLKLYLTPPYDNQEFKIIANNLLNSNMALDLTKELDVITSGVKSFTPFDITAFHREEYSIINSN